MLKQHIQREVILNVVLNAFINGGIAYGIFRLQKEVPMWGKHGFALDLILTACLLMFLLSWIVILLHRRKVAKGKLNIHQWDLSNPLQRRLQRLPYSPLLSSLLFGAVGLFIIAPVTLLSMAIMGINTLSPMEFALFKAVWAGIIGGLLVGPVILLGLAAQDKLNS